MVIKTSQVHVNSWTAVIYSNRLTFTVQVSLHIFSIKTTCYKNSWSTYITAICFNNSCRISQTFLCVKRKVEMEIHVEFLTGKIITVYVEPSDTIQIVKMKIEEKEGIPPNKQSLMFSSNLLRDDRTLSFYGIRPDSVFHLLMKNHIWDRLNFMYSEKASRL